MDPSSTTRFVGNVQFSGDGVRANVYGQYYDWSMFSNPTYANADGSSAQIRQFDRRWIVGGRAEKAWELAPAVQLKLGTENRYDHIGNVGVYNTSARAFVASLGRFAVDEASGSLYGEATWKPLTGLRLTGGVRGDYYDYDVRARDAVAAALGQGGGHDAILSPKAAVAYSPVDQLEFYANWGRGFHSNDVRGAVNDATPVPVLVRGTGKELGARFQVPHLTLTATYYWIDVDSELRFVGDSNAVEPTGASRRRGYELVGFWRPFPWLALDGNYTATHARYDNGDSIPNAFENAASAGISAVLDHFEASVRLRHLGPYPLIEDDSVRDKGSTVVNMRGAWKPRGGTGTGSASGIQVYAELLNVLNSKDKDIAYYYESYIPSVDAAPQEGRLSRVVEPRTFRVGARYTF